MAVSLTGWADRTLSCAATGVAPRLAASLALSVSPPAHNCARNTPHSADLTARRCGSKEMTDANALWECEGYTNVSYTNLPNSPWPPSRRLFTSLSPDVSGDALRCGLVSTRAPPSRPRTFQQGHRPGLVSWWKKPRYRTNVSSLGGGLGIPRSNQAIHQKCYFCTF